MTFNSLFIGKKGINAHQTAINTTTNNIANVNSIAFKKSTVGFESTLTNTQTSGSGANGNLGSTNPKTIGTGVLAANLSTNFDQGNLRNVREQSKLALEGDGFFALSSTGEIVNGQVQDLVYSRDGNFSIDAEGNMVTNQGEFVMGIMFYDETTEEMKSINSPAYTTINYISEQDIGSNIKEQTSPSFDVNSIGSADFDLSKIAELSVRSGFLDKSLSISDGALDFSFDGNFIKITFTETSGDIESPLDTFSVSIDPSMTFENKAMTFELKNANGQLLQLRMRVKPEVIRLNEVLKGFIFDKDLNLGSSLSFGSARDSTTTQVGNSVTLANDDLPYISYNEMSTLLAPMKMPPIFYSPDPNSDVSLSKYGIGVDGTLEIEGKNSSGGRMAIGKILLSNFNNLEALVNTGNGQYRTSSNSGPASLQVIAGPSSNPNLNLNSTRIISGTLEFSNVDVANELTKMIAYQRGLQGSARVVTVADELMQVLLQL